MRRMKSLMTVTGIILLICIMITGLYAPKGTAVEQYRGKKIQAFCV